MQLLPDPQHARPLAVGLALLVLVLIYLVFFHWFFLRHAALGDEISKLREDNARFAVVAATRPAIEQRLESLRTTDRNNDLFLRGNSFDAAAADMTQRLKQIIATQADHEKVCNVISNRNVRPREVQRFEKVLVQVRLRCNLGDFVKTIHALRSSAPLVLLDDVNIYQRYVPIPGRERYNQNEAELDIRFEMYGYLAGAADRQGAEDAG